jgi:hypothetical protein
MQLAHVLFVIDRQAWPVRTHYIDTPRYQLHARFVRDTGLLPRAGKREIDRNYLVPDRRFLFGTLSWQQNIGSFTYEFWEGDRLTPALLRQADAQVKASFFAPVKFKTNATLHERVAQEAGIDFVSQEALIREQPYLPMNLGTATGRVRIVEDESDTERHPRAAARRHRRAAPSADRPAARGRRADRAAVDRAVARQPAGQGLGHSERLRARCRVGAEGEHAGQWVALKVAGSGYQVRRLTPEEIAALPPRAVRAVSVGAAPGGARAIPPDLRETRLLPLAALRARNSAQCGVKAANLGALQAARIAGTSVPDGFCIPFAHYDRFMRAKGLAARIARMRQEPGFASDPKARQKALAQLRDEIVQWPVEPPPPPHGARRGSRSWAAAGVRAQLVQLRRPAGLQRRGPVQHGAQREDRRRARARGEEGLGLCVQPRGLGGARRRGLRRGVGADGRVRADRHRLGQRRVMITRDPFDAGHAHVTYISAKRGIGIRVVEGQRVAEQVMYSSWSKAVQVLSRSAEDTSLQLDKDGGVKEVPVEAGRNVLTDALVVRLANVGAAVKRTFGGVDQDIEWATVGDGVVLLQARPYVERRR